MYSFASLFLEHAMGSHQRDRSLLYISPGTNYWGLPLRIGALPEVTVITLRIGPHTTLTINARAADDLAYAHDSDAARGAAGVDVVRS